MKDGYSEWHPSAGDWQIDAAWLAKFNACDAGLNWFTANYGEQSVSARELLATVDAVPGDWAEWLVDAGLKYLLSLGKLPEGFTHCGGSLDLKGYGHALPEGFTHCGGSLDLEGYGHALPEGFTHCGGSLDLRGYGHALPEGFTHCGGSLDLEGYGHALPKGFKKGGAQ